jgi:hypothetical protein
MAREVIPVPALPPPTLPLSRAARFAALMSLDLPVEIACTAATPDARGEQP